MAGSSDFHFSISIALAFLSGLLWIALRRDGGLFHASVAALLGALWAGLTKEFVDLLTNPWHMAGAGLRGDSARDMLWNCAGALVGAFGVALALTARRGLIATSARPVPVLAVPGALPPPAGNGSGSPGLPGGDLPA